MSDPFLFWLGGVIALSGLGVAACAELTATDWMALVFVLAIWPVAIPVLILFMLSEPS